MKAVVIGAGYVGLTTAIALAWIGHDVAVVETDRARLALLRRGHAPFYEAHLESVLHACGDRIRFTDALGGAAEGADVVFVAVGTPPRSDGAPDLSQLEAALDGLRSALSGVRRSVVVVVKSTVPSGTGDAFAERVRRAGLDDRVAVASNPEFLRQGRALRDSLVPDRIVIGGPPAARAVLRELYRPILDQDFELPPGVPNTAGRPAVSLLEVDRRSAELAKYTANAFLAMRISFINEIANICDRVGADVDAVASIIGADPRIGRHFLHAGVGYGGSCFPKDTRALHHMATTNGYDFEVLSAVIRVNRRQRLRVVEKLEAALGELRGRRIALLGLAFKPGTDDMRGAPSVPLAEALTARGADVRAHDPRAMGRAREVLPASVELFDDVTGALQDAHGAVLVTEWPEYLALPATTFRELMHRPLVIDGRNAFGEDVRRTLEYHGIGRGGLGRAPDQSAALAAD